MFHELASTVPGNIGFIHVSQLCTLAPAYYSVIGFSACTLISAIQAEQRQLNETDPTAQGKRRIQGKRATKSDIRQSATCASILPQSEDYVNYSTSTSRVLRSLDANVKYALSPCS